MDRELLELQAEIDDRCFALYGIDATDRASIEAGFSGGGEAAAEGGEAEPDETDDDEAEPTNVGAEGQVRALVSWTIGVAFGRFDVRLATGERPMPPEPEPFDPLPACSPGMLTGDDGLPVATPPPGYPIAFPKDGILVDDPGAERDLIGRVRQVFAVVFGAEADERLREAAELLEPGAGAGDGDLRPWLRRRFFDEHIKHYSKSRRKAPIYWRLGTPSGSFGVWVYIHRMGPDTLHAARRDHVEPKLRYETERLAKLQTEAGDAPAPSQRREIDAQERLVDELRDLRATLERLAPLWNPDLDDGVVINASFLHPLFAHTRAWQKECAGHWAKLAAGDYDWAHLAMRLWPERVVPRCCEDRSLAIAHGLEETLWVEDDEGKWHPRAVDEATVAQLVRERTSPAVKDALHQLAQVPAPTKRSAAPRAPRQPRAPKAPRQPRAARSAQAAAAKAASSSSAAVAPASARPAQPIRAPGETAADASAETDALAALRAALARFPEGATKAELFAASGLDDAQAKRALDALLASGEASKTGKARGTRYRRGAQPT